MIRRTVYTLAALSLVACAAPGEGMADGKARTHFVVEGDDDFVNVVRSAAAQWDLFCGTHITVTTDPAAHGVRVYRDPTLDSHWKGYADYQDGEFRIRITTENHPFPYLMRDVEHEIGHMLGLRHVDDPKSVMYKDMNDYTNPTPDLCAAIPEETE